MDLKTAREKKDRGFTVKEVINEAIKNETETKSIVIMTVSNDGDIETSYSTDNFTGMLGVIEQSKHMMISEECYE